MRHILTYATRMISLLIAILALIATGVLGYRVILLLIDCKLNPALCLEFLGSATITGITMAICNYLSEDNMVEREFKNIKDEVNTLTKSIEENTSSTIEDEE